MLVNLVRGGVSDAKHERRSDAAERAEQQEAEHGVLGDVRALSQHLVPGAEP